MPTAPAVARRSVVRSVVSSPVDAATCSSSLSLSVGVEDDEHRLSSPWLLGRVQRVYLLDRLCSGYRSCSFPPCFPRFQACQRDARRLQSNHRARRRNAGRSANREVYRGESSAHSFFSYHAGWVPAPYVADRACPVLGPTDLLRAKLATHSKSRCRVQSACLGTLAPVPYRAKPCPGIPLRHAVQLPAADVLPFASFCRLYHQ